MKIFPFLAVMLVIGAVGAAAAEQNLFEELSERAKSAAQRGRPETNINIQGLEGTDLLNVQLILGARYEIIRSLPASASRADDAAFILEHVLEDDGYADARVSWRIAHSREIVLIVEEGRRIVLNDVKVEGVEPDEAGKLARLFSKSAEKDRPLGIGPPPYRGEDNAKGIAYVKQELNATGYWAADVALGSVKITDNKADVVVKVNPGPLHVIGNATISGEAGARGIILPIARSYAGRPAVTKNLNGLRKEVTDAIVAGGYPKAEVRMAWHLEGAKFHPDFGITLGEKVRLRSVKVAGLDKTNPERVLVRMRGLEGEWYDEGEMSKRMSTMLSTGAFSTARLETTDAGGGTIDATLHLQEAKAREITIAAGLDSYYGPIGRIQYTDRNWMGELLGLTTGIEVSSRGVFGEYKVSDPWIYGSDFGGYARGFLLLFDRDGYLKYETGIEGGLDWRPTDHYKLDLKAVLSGAKVQGEGLPDSELGMTEYTNPRIRFTQKLDFRDNPVVPKEGWHLESPFELGMAIGTEAVPYISHGISGGWYKPIHRKYDIGLGGELGVLVPLGDSDELPIDMRYFNGGPRSVRSFPERELGPSANGYARGGESMWNTNVELIRHVTDSLKGVVFFDAGGLGQYAGDLFAGEIEFAAGLGVRFDLPIGPVRLEYGHNLTRDAGEPGGAFHFAIGTAF